MVFLFAFLGLFAGLVAYHTWAMVMRYFGYLPLHHHPDQAHIVAKNAAIGGVDEQKQKGYDPSPDEEDEALTHLYCFARRVIYEYTMQIEYQSHDVTPDPDGIHEKRIASGEVSE